MTDANGPSGRRYRNSRARDCPDNISQEACLFMPWAHDRRKRYPGWQVPVCVYLSALMPIICYGPFPDRRKRRSHGPMTDANREAMRPWAMADANGEAMGPWPTQTERPWAHDRRKRGGNGPMTDANGVAMGP